MPKNCLFKEFSVVFQELFEQAFFGHPANLNSVTPVEQLTDLDVAQAIGQDCQAVTGIGSGRLQVVAKCLPQRVDVPASSKSSAPEKCKVCCVPACL